MNTTPETSRTGLRHESKIPLQRNQYVELQSALIQLGQHPRTSFPDRIIHSIYLDDHELNDYHDNITGISQRSKTRIRWYDDHTNKLVFEIKRKIIKVSDKRIIKIDNPAYTIPRFRSDYMKLIRSNSRLLPISQFISLFPVIEVEYNRSYFEVAEDIRMTADRSIRYRKLYPQPSKRWQRSPVDSVIEFKYPVGKEDAFERLLRNIPSRIFRHSKYVIGIDSVCVG